MIDNKCRTSDLSLNIQKANSSNIDNIAIANNPTAHVLC